MKKIISVFLSLVMIINVFALFSINDISAEAADYAAELRSKGFPESYIDSLVSSRSTIVSIQPCTSAFESVLSTEENVKRSVMLLTAPI